MAKQVATVLVLAAAATLVLVVAVAEAGSIITPTSHTSTVDQGVENDGRRCREQLQQQKEQLQHCNMYLSPAQSPSQQQQRQEKLEQCCKVLEGTEEKCRCVAVKVVAQEEQQKQGQQKEMREVMLRAENLLRDCGLEPQHCEIKSGLYVLNI